MGWTSRAAGWVGVGASPWDDEEEVRRRYAFDPARRFQELADERAQDPVRGWLHTVTSPFEAANTAIDYGLGIAQGAAQAGMERYGWTDPGTRLGELANQSAQRPWSDVPVLGGPARLAEIAGRGLFELESQSPKLVWGELNGQVAPRPIPPELRHFNHPLGDEESRYLPEVRNIFDPGEAMGRFKALTPEPAQMGLEMLASAGLGAVTRLPMQGLNAANEAVIGALRPGAGAWKPLENIAATTLGEKTAAALTSTPAKLGTVLGAPLLGAAGMAATTPEGGGPRETLERAGEGALSGLMIGATLLGAQHGAERMTRILGKLPDPPPNPMNRVLDPLTQDKFNQVQKDARAADAYPPRPPHPLTQGAGPNAMIVPHYPSGPFGDAFLNWTWAKFRTWFSDAGAPLNDLTESLRRSAEASGKQWEPEYELQRQYTLLHGEGAKVEQVIRRGVPTAGRPSQVVTAGAYPILRDAGIRTTDQLSDLNDVYLAAVAVDRSTRMVPDPKTGAMIAEPLSTGHLGVDSAAQQAHLDMVKQLATDKWTPGVTGPDSMGERMHTAVGQLTAFMNSVGDYGQQGGMMHPDAWLAAKRDNNVYGLLQWANDHFDATWKRPELPTEPVTATSTPIGHYFSSDDPTHRVKIDLMEQMDRAANTIQFADMNRFAQNIVKTAEEFPNELGTWIRPLDGPQSRIEKGWAQFAVWQNGEEKRYATPQEFADLLRGVNVQAADQITGLMGKMNNAFRKGVTVWNVPFILGNMPRDVYHAMVNTGMPIDIIRQFTGAFLTQLTEKPDEWFRANAHLPGVGNLPKTLWENFDDHVLKPYAGVNRDIPREAINAGAGMSTLTSVMRGPEATKSLLGVDRPLGQKLLDPGAWYGMTIGKGTDLLEAISDITETSTRMAVYRAAISRGMSTEAAALTSREATVDYSKSGTAMRLANLWFPLLNARVQGNLRDFRAMRDDPLGTGIRMTALAGVPQLLTYAWNRTAFPDLYEQIPSEERMRNHIIVFGSIKDDQDRVKPAYIRIPKDQIAAAYTVPLEHILDTMYHTREHGQVLTPNQRTDTPTSYMIMRTIGSMLPWDAFPDELTNPLAWINQAASMNPIANTAIGISANEDPFRRLPIVPSEEMVLPPEYRSGPQTPAMYKALSHTARRIFDRMGVDSSGMDFLAPATMQYTARSLGMNLPDYIAQQMDLAIPKLQEIGLVEPGAFQPATPEDLRLPPGTPIQYAYQYLDQLQSPDARPLYMRLFSRFVGSSSRGPSMQERASKLGSREQEQAKQTQEFNQEYQHYLVDWRKRVNELDLAPDQTHAHKIDEMQKLSRERQGAFNALQSSHLLAITDQRALRDFQANLPGAGSEWMLQNLPQLPEGWNGKAIAEYLQAPRGQDMASLGPIAQYQARRKALNVLSQQLGQPVALLEQHAGLYKIGAEVPAISVPNMAVEQAINSYMNPVDHHGQLLDRLTTPPHLYRQAQDAQIQNIAQAWGVPPDQAEATIRARLTGNPIELTEDGVSRTRATMLFQRLHDPEKFPVYVNPDGTAMGDEAQWADWDVQLDSARERYHNRLPPQYARLDAAKKLGEMQQIQALVQGGPQLLGPLPPIALADYERWYGTGKQMTTRQWYEYQSGALPRYTQGSPADWAQWDTMQKLYAATPPGAMKERMRNQVRRIRQLQTPGWRDILQADQLHREEALWETGADTSTAPIFAG
jgi:hypothetical protein